ncbi:autotransporter assembly complex protein TamA [Aureimonas fodinaquatilis]|uniref:autotransporter assembly complex protein TamA n=1 Tax=Aureimonas fodinaquatilis TaxID=2565783 RepID=UPI001FE741DF|nr:autotransporter assembly complex family protein [Aureimonas fodinaquatilis]
MRPLQRNKADRIDTVPLHRKGFARTFTASIVCACLLASAPAAGAFELFGFKFFGRYDEADTVIDPVNYSVTLTVSPADDDLEKALNAASTLVADAEKPVSGSLGLLAKARNDRRRLVAALYEQSRYDGLVTITIEGQNIAGMAPDASFDTSRPVPVAITVQPGQLYKMGTVRLTTDGPPPLSAEEYELTPGSSADSVRLLKAENQIYLDVENTGRPFAAILHRDVVADSARGTLDYDLSLSPGSPVPFGRTVVTGANAVRPGFIAYMTGIKPGTIYSREELQQARDRLNALNVFSSVTVKAADGQEPDGTLPVLVEVSERPFRVIGAGATFSNTDGAGVNGYWQHRNLFGGAESIRLEGSVTRIGANELSSSGREVDGVDYKVGAEFRKPGVLGPDSVYIGSLTTLREQPLAYNRESIAGFSGVEYKIDKRQTVHAGVLLEYEEIEDYLGKRDFLIGSIPVTYTFDARDDALNPTEGYLLKVMGEPSYDAEGSVAFFKARGDASAYLSLDENDRFIVAGRVAYGTMAGADLADIPNDRRFYAGGGGSVRGYVYQSIGPYYPDFAPPGTNPNFVDTPIGGLSLFEASLEMRIGITESIQIVPFIDGGTVSDDLFPDFGEFKLGAGVGARYLTGFGPIRIDVGIPLDPGPRDGSFQIYAGIGQAF